MIERDTDDDTFEVSCSFCNEYTFVDTDGDWATMLEDIKQDGWKIRKINDDWKHMCPACVAKGVSWVPALKKW